MVLSSFPSCSSYNLRCLLVALTWSLYLDAQYLHYARDSHNLWEVPYTFNSSVLLASHLYHLPYVLNLYIVQCLSIYFLSTNCLNPPIHSLFLGDTWYCFILKCFRFKAPHVHMASFGDTQYCLFLQMFRPTPPQKHCSSHTQYEFFSTFKSNPFSSYARTDYTQRLWRNHK